MKRRIFLSNAVLALAGAAVAGCGAGSKKSYGLQLYTLRDILQDNTKVKDTVKQLVDLGYNEFEAYGYSNGNIFGMTYKDFTDYVKGLGAKVTSAHYDIDVIRTDWERAVADAKAAGQD